jgi:nucleoside-diphosphate-sugar epimerase
MTGGKDVTKKVLITGASGFIGRHCVPLLLERGYEVHAVARRPLFTPNLDLNWHQVDIFDLPDLQKLMVKVRPSHLLHLAWYAAPGKYWTALDNFRWVTASLDLVRIFQENGGSRITVAGTCAEYDWQYGYCSEGTMTNPQTPYGVCKNSLHQMLDSFCQHSKLSMAWGRIFWLYGRYEHPNRLVSFVVRSLLAERVAECSSGYQIRDFLYVNDVANALIKLLDSDLNGSVNIASGVPITIRELVCQIAMYLDRADLVRFRSVSEQEREANLVVANSDKLRFELNWNPQFTISQGIEDVVNFWKNHDIFDNH